MTPGGSSPSPGRRPACRDARGAGEWSSVWPRRRCRRSIRRLGTRSTTRPRASRSLDSAGRDAGRCSCPRAWNICKRGTPRSSAFCHQLCPECSALSHASATRAPTSPDAGAARRRARARSACTSRCGCCATAPTPTITRVPARSRAPFREPCPTAPTGCTGCAISASTCATRRRSWRCRRCRSDGHARHPAQQRGADGPRSAGAYTPLAEAERAPLPSRSGPDGGPDGDVRRTSDLSTRPASPRARRSASSLAAALRRPTADALAMTAGSADLPIDAGGLVPDARHEQLLRASTRSSTRVVEVQLCNQTAPFMSSVGCARRWPRIGSANVRRQRLGDGRPVRPRLQGRWAPAHQHVQGRAQHAHPHQRCGDARDATASDDRRRHRLVRCTSVRTTSYAATVDRRQ